MYIKKMNALAGLGATGYVPQQGFLNNFGTGGEQTGWMFHSAKDAWDRQQWKMTHQVPGSSTPGVGCIGILDEQGQVVMDGKYDYDGRTYCADDKGRLKFVQTSTFMPAIQNFQEHQQRLNAIAAFAQAVIKWQRTSLDPIF